MELTPRKERILSSVVAGYVKSGEPVGSKAVAEEVGVSSATVRNEMADLIELGLLEQPHTSAGRVPSQKGYREYVDRLMEVPPVKEEERRVFDSMLLSGSYEPEQLLGRAARAARRTNETILQLFRNFATPRFEGRAAGGLTWRPSPSGGRWP